MAPGLIMEMFGLLDLGSDLSKFLVGGSELSL